MDQRLKEQSCEMMHTVLLSKCKINLQLKYFSHMPLASSHSNRPYGFHQQQNLEDTVEERERLMVLLLILEAGCWVRSRHLKDIRSLTVPPQNGLISFCKK